MSSVPNYEGLIRQLLVLRRLPDAAGEATLTSEEAAKIQSLGFDAAPGCWKVPLLPPELVRGNPILEPLAADRDPFWMLRTDLPPIPRSGSRQGPDKPSWQGSKTTATPQVLGKVTDDPRERLHEDQRPMPAHPRGTDWELVKALASKIPAMVERAGGEIDKRRLQQKCWRYPAAIFNQAVRLTVEQGRIMMGRK